MSDETRDAGGGLGFEIEHNPDDAPQSALRDLIERNGYEPEDLMRGLAGLLRDDAAERRHGADKVAGPDGIEDDPYDLAVAARWERQAALLENAAAEDLQGGPAE